MFVMRCCYNNIVLFSSVLSYQVYLPYMMSGEEHVLSLPKLVQSMVTKSDLQVQSSERAVGVSQKGERVSE